MVGAIYCRKDVIFWMKGRNSPDQNKNPRISPEASHQFTSVSIKPYLPSLRL